MLYCLRYFFIWFSVFMETMLWSCKYFIINCNICNTFVERPAGLMGLGRMLLALVALLAWLFMYFMVYMLFLLPKILECLTPPPPPNFAYNLHFPNATFVRLNNFIFGCNIFPLLHSSFCSFTGSLVPHCLFGIQFTVCLLLPCLCIWC